MKYESSELKRGDKIETYNLGAWGGDVKILYLPPDGWKDIVRSISSRGEIKLQNWFFGIFSVSRSGYHIGDEVYDFIMMHRYTKIK